jgi:hypothetical protein
MADCEEAVTTHMCFNTASRPATMPCPANIEQLMKHLGRVVGYEKRLRTPARLLPGGGEGGNKLGGVFSNQMFS